MKRALIALLLLAALGAPGATAQTKGDKKDRKTQSAAPVAQPAPAKAPTTGAILANKDSRIFHRADCKLAAKMKEANRTSFASSVEASKAGYKACKVCKP